MYTLTITFYEHMLAKLIPKRNGLEFSRHTIQMVYSNKSQTTNSLAYLLRRGCQPTGMSPQIYFTYNADIQNKTTPKAKPSLYADDIILG